MTDTRLILSGAKGVKGGPQRERERNSAGGVLLCFVLCSFTCSFSRNLFFNSSLHSKMLAKLAAFYTANSQQ